MKLLCVFGTRPETIKMAPLVKVLKKRFGKSVKVCVTAQHRQMLDPFLKLFQIHPDYDLNLMKPNQSITDITCAVLKKFGDIFNKFKPDYVVVQGDTTTAFAGGLAAFYHKVAVVHVEAGLRTYNKYSPWPEELNRKLLTSLADIHCAPSKLAARRLLKEGVPRDRVFVTGNTIVDALHQILTKFEHDAKLRRECAAKFSFLDPSKKLILVTMHRRESFGKPFEQICLALKKLAKRDDVQIVYPVHLNQNVRKPVFKILGNVPNIHLIEPVDYFQFVYLMLHAYLLLTDSGGVEEEAPVLGVPALVLRETTERPEIISLKEAKLVGTDQKIIYNEAIKLISSERNANKMKLFRSAYGEGNASQLILDAILKRRLT